MSWIKQSAGVGVRDTYARLSAGVSRFKIKFTRDRAGNISIIFGLLVIPLVSMVGLTVDFTSAIRERARMQASLDAAVLAGAREFQVTGNPEAAKDRAKAFYDSLTGCNSNPSCGVNADIVGGGVVLELTSTSAVKTSFMSVLEVVSTGSDYEELPVSGGAKAELVGEKINTEVSMMLDVTGSMSGDKMADLKIAAKDLIDIVVQDDQSEFTTRVALAPFSVAVRLQKGNFYRAVHGNNDGKPNDSDNARCVVGRSGAEAYTDAAPGPGKYFQNYSEQSEYQYYTTCPLSGGKIWPLTSNKTQLKNRINQLPTVGGTAGHLGSAWAWYLISPKWHNVIKNKYDISRAPANTMVDVKKIAILMSDGQYNTKWVNGPGSDSQADTICANMNAAGIEVFTVGFGLTEHSTAYNTLKDCASTSVNFFPASTGAELRAAFRTIGFKIAAIRLVE